MNKQDKKTRHCSIEEKDHPGRSNLCCCWVVDEDGQYDTPCHTPVEECCNVPDAGG